MQICPGHLPDGTRHALVISEVLVWWWRIEQQHFSESFAGLLIIGIVILQSEGSSFSQNFLLVWWWRTVQQHFSEYFACLLAHHRQRDPTV